MKPKVAVAASSLEMRRLGPRIAPPLPRSPSDDPWNVKTTDDGFSFVASEGTHTRLGVRRWLLETSIDGAIDFSGLDANDEVLGRTRLRVFETNAKTTIAISHQSEEGLFAGLLVTLADERILHDTLHDLTPVAAWMRKLLADLEAYKDAHAAPSASDEACHLIMATIGTAVISVVVGAIKTSPSIRFHFPADQGPLQRLG